MSTFCSYFNQAHCQSCSWIEKPYADQIALKEKTIQDSLTFFLPFTLETPITSPLQGFRNRAKMAVTGSVNHPIIGILGNEYLDKGRELLNCPIHHPKLNELMSGLPEFIHSYNLIPYNIAKKKGELKGLIAFYSQQTNQMYLRFVLRSQECVSRIQKMMPTLQKKFPELVCISANIQPIAHAVLEGPTEIILTPQKTMKHQVGDVLINLSPQAFVQTNNYVASQLYESASNWISTARPSKMLDLFCGQGAFCFALANSTSEILGIEINQSATDTATQSANEMGFSHIKFKCLDATHVSHEAISYGPDLIIANPPRRGLTSAANLIQELHPRHFLYSSCSIESLTADLRKLVGFYKINRIQLFDMFPHTEHFETLVWLEKK